MNLQPRNSKSTVTQAVPSTLILVFVCVCRRQGPDPAGHIGRPEHARPQWRAGRHQPAPLGLLGQLHAVAHRRPPDGPRRWQPRDRVGAALLHVLWSWIGIKCCTVLPNVVIASASILARVSCGLVRAHALHGCRGSKESVCYSRTAMSTFSSRGRRGTALPTRTGRADIQSASDHSSILLGIHSSSSRWSFTRAFIGCSLLI